MPAGTLLLDYIRYYAGLKGTKIGCREGDCGACTILAGEIINGKLVYKSETSCLVPLGNASNQHIVTIEGINGLGLTPVQQCFSDAGATQCGFCTPGFIVSLTGYCMNERSADYAEAIDSINGNICRCTGYKSIERAVHNFSDVLRLGRGISLLNAVAQNIVPEYFSDIENRLKLLQNTSIGPAGNDAKIVGGGTDLYVQQHEAMVDADIHFIQRRNQEKKITQKSGRCEIAGNATVSDMASSDIFQKSFSSLSEYIKQVSSTQIRNMATIAGNFCNASPIGDLTIFFLALDANLSITDGKLTRNISLEKFYKGYKDTDLLPHEFVEAFTCLLPAADSYFNFEKVSKRMHLDIASVNSAIYLRMEGDLIAEARISAGGVGPIPLYLKNSSAFLVNKNIGPGLIIDMINLVQAEISPISDARGSAGYKRLLLSQLIKAHFIKLFPSMRMESLITETA